jgi:hypothetical protein
MSTDVQQNLSLTKEQAETVIRKHLGGHEQSTVSLLTEIKNTGYRCATSKFPTYPFRSPKNEHSYTAGFKTYILDLKVSSGQLNGASSPVPLGPSSCFLTIARPINGEASVYHHNSLSVVYQILTRIRSHTDIPIPDSTLDVSLQLVPYQYLLSPASPISSTDIIPLSKARALGLLSPTDTLLLDLQIGKFLGQLHSGVQNDWYGIPALTEPQDASYSWQETFMHLLEDLLHRFQAAGVELPYSEIRTYLSRAIAFFLFDDVEVPSLIWLSGSEDDIYVSLPTHLATKTHSIAAILPNVAHALWGDPLLESFFLSPGPSEALLEGYVGSGGGPLMSLPRKKTKRVWYTLFLALVVLSEHTLQLHEPLADESSEIEKQCAWAQKTITECVVSLKDAPCY